MLPYRKRLLSCLCLLLLAGAMFSSICFQKTGHIYPNAYDMDGFYWYYSMNPEATDALHTDNGAVAVLLQELAGEV